MNDTVLENSSSGTADRLRTSILEGPGLGHLTGPGVGALNDTVLENSSSGTADRLRTSILGGPGLGHRTWPTIT